MLESTLVSTYNDCAGVSKITFAGQESFIFYFDGAELSEKNCRAEQFANLVRAANFVWLNELVPSFDSCLVEYDSLCCDHHHVLLEIKALLKQSSLLQLSKSNAPCKITYDKTATGVNDCVENEHVFPVYYDPEHDVNDLAIVVAAKNLSVEEVIDIHVNTAYRVYAVGFQPGFAYLAQTDARIAMPRLAKPRLKVPKGAVAIADQQTAIYPNSSPGGWHILGLCPLDLTQKALSKSAMKIGDTVRFQQISQAQYTAMLEQSSSSLL